jgi:hypothetical protein
MTSTFPRVTSVCPYQKCYLTVNHDLRYNLSSEILIHSLHSVQLPRTALKFAQKLCWILPSSGLLRSVYWLSTDVSGQPIGPIFKSQVTSFLDTWRMKMGPVGYLETSVLNPTLRKNPEHGRIQVNRRGSLRSRQGLLNIKSVSFVTTFIRNIFHAQQVLQELHWRLAQKRLKVFIKKFHEMRLAVLYLC